MPRPGPGGPGMLPADTSGRFARPPQTGMHPHQTGQGPLPPRSPAKSGRSMVTGCLTALVITLVLLALLIAALVWVLRDPPESEVGAPARAAAPSLLVSHAAVTRA